MSNIIKKPSALMLLGANLLSIIGCFLPFISFLGESFPFIEGDGVFVLILCIISIILTFKKAILAFIPNIIALVITFISIFNVAEFSLDFLAIGAYIIVIANIVAIVGSLLSKKI